MTTIPTPQPPGPRLVAPESVPLRIDQLIAYKLELRDKIEQIEEAQKTHLAPYKEKMDKLDGMLTQWLQSTGQESAKTAEGSISIRPYWSAPLADPDAFMEYVVENNAWQLLERRANSTACRDFADEKGSLPPGVKLNCIRKLIARRPS